jgi:carboxypeptidase T
MGGVKTSRNPNNHGPNSIWCGPGPASEPETKAISDLMKKEKFRSSITYHNFSQLILYPDAAEADKFVQEVGNGLKELTNEFAEEPYTYESGSALYKTTGDAMEFAYEASPGRPSYTPELRPASPEPEEHIFSGLPEDQIEPCFNENLGAALALINCAGSNGAPAAGHSVTVTGNLVQVAVNMNCWQVFKGWKP